MIIKDIKEQVKGYFFLNPTKRLRIRQIEREVKIPLPSAIRYKDELIKEGILKKIELADVVLFAADRSSKKFLIEKKLFNIRSLYLSGLIDYLVLEYNNTAIVVFGSYSKGEDIEASDIDIYMETPQKPINLKKFENILHRNIQSFNFKNIHAVDNKELANNIINGIVMNGFIEVFKHQNSTYVS